MIKRTTLLWKKAGLSDAQFRALWLGEHVAHARRMPGLREYVIDFVTDGPEGAPAGVATVRFDTRDALDRGFQDPTLRPNLLRTRDAFAEAVQVLFVDEHVIVRDGQGR
jgi:hypothetical protein